MPLVGGGGAGNTAGSNPSGTGSVLNYIGEHVYAYSGTFPATTSAQTTLEFTTGSEYIVGEMVTNGAITFGTASGGLITAFQISLNGEVVAITQIDTQSDHSPGPPTIPLVLAPYTHVKVEVDSDDNNASILSTTMFTGRVY